MKKLIMKFYEVMISDNCAKEQLEVRNDFLPAASAAAGLHLAFKVTLNLTECKRSLILPDRGSGL